MATIQASVKYQGRYIGNVTITLRDTNSGTAPIDGRTRIVTYKMATQGSKKNTMQWHCNDI